MKRQAGFAALELLLVCCLMLILAAAALPRFDVLAGVQADYEAACLAADLRYMQELSRQEAYRHEGLAVAKTSVAQLHLSVGIHGYQIMRDGVSSPLVAHTCKGDIRMGTGEMGRTGNVSFAADGDIIPAPCTIHIWSKKQHRVVIIDQAGRIRVERRQMDEG